MLKIGYVIVDAVFSAVVTKEVQSGTEPEPLVSSSNPFLLMAENKADETADAPENAVDSVSHVYVALGKKHSFQSQYEFDQCQLSKVCSLQFCSQVFLVKKKSSKCLVDLWVYSLPEVSVLCDLNQAKLEVIALIFWCWLFLN